MTPLDYPNHHHVNAASGWLELGNPDEARAELAKIPDDQLEHPDVLAVRWRLHASEDDWGKALEVSRRHVLAQPSAAEAWINQSYSLHELQRTNEAFRELRRVVDRFNLVGTIPYNLACYTCRMGLLDEARTWLKRAKKILGRAQLVVMAAEDPDLEPLRGALNDI